MRPESTTSAPLGPRLAALSLATGQLPGPAVRLLGGALAEIDRLTARQVALRRAANILDGGQGASLWESAQRLETALARFRPAYRRIAAGHRAPHTELETALTVLSRDGPQSARRLWEEMRMT